MQNPARYYGADSLVLQCVFGRISWRADFALSNSQREPS